MSGLPPYSTFRTDNKQQIMYPQAISHGNVLSFTPPGFHQTLNVKFPDSRLAVCEKCKKNYKTRDMCRVRNSHTAEPWTTAYICITLDETCTGADGKYIDKPFTVRMVQWQPFCVKKPFDLKTPVCSACKKTNRTRSFCRDRHQHRHLPWCTVYVVLSAAESADPNTIVAAPSVAAGKGDEKDGVEEKKGEGPAATTSGESNFADAKEGVGDEEAKESEEGEQNGDTKRIKVDTADQVSNGDAKISAELDNLVEASGESEVAKAAAAAQSAAEGGEDGGDDGEAPDKEKSGGKASRKRKVPEEDDDPGDDIHKIETSRTFLAKVSCRGTTIHWLEMAEFEAGTGGTTHGMHPSMVSPDGAQVHALQMRGPVMGMPVAGAMDPTQYYAQMSAMGYQQQHILQVQQQHFMHMQQRQHQHFAVAAHQAAWQAQYAQQMQAAQHMGGQVMVPGAPPGVMPPAAPGVMGAPPGASPVVAPGAPPATATPGGTAASPGGAAGPTENPKPPVTAGEAAAAQQQKKQQGGGSSGAAAATPPPGTAAPGAPTSAGAAAAAAAAAQQQMHAQWLYQHQLFQHQLQVQQAAAAQQQGMHIAVMQQQQQQQPPGGRPGGAAQANGAGDAGKGDGQGQGEQGAGTNGSNSVKGERTSI